MQFSIRQGTGEKDFSLIQALNAALFAEEENNDAALDTHWPMSVVGVEYYMKSLMDPQKIVFIAEDDQRNPVGYIIGSMVNKWQYRVVKTGELENMYVIPSARSQGVGSALVEKIKQWLMARRVERLYVSAYTTNYKAIAFYQANGFAPWETGMEVTL